VIVFLSLSKNLHEFWTRGPEYTSSGQLRRICGSQPEYRIFLNYVRPWLVLVLVMALPFVLILIFNCLIVRGLVRAQRVRAESIPACSEAAGSSRSGSNLRQTAFMCLGISLAFLICIAPSIVLLIGKPYWKHRTNVTYNSAKAVSNFLVFVNHCVNFFLYCVTGRHFRERLATMMTRKRPQAPGSPGINTSSRGLVVPNIKYQKRHSDFSGLPVSKQARRDIRARMSLGAI